MNAAEQAQGLEAAAKIAAVVTLFKAQFPDVRADLRPWANDPDTRELVDPDSIDIGFHLPGWSPRFRARSMLAQVRLLREHQLDLRAIGIEIVGFTHEGEQWRLSTVADWQVRGQQLPAEDIKEKLKLLCRQIFELFNSDTGRSHG